MFSHTKADHGQLKSRLTSCRQMMSLIDRDIAAASDEIQLVTENWVPMWVDTGHTITSDCGQLRAIRSIGFDGTLMWFVKHPDKKHGYHSAETCPFAAFEDAETAWRRRADVRAEWKFVEQIAADLLAGRKKFSVTRADAHASPLCSAGIDGFMARMGMPNVQKMSGRSAALLMKIDPQLGFVIREAHRRHAREQRAKVKNPVSQTVQV